jgi:lipoate-protein ligase A
MAWDHTLAESLTEDTGVVRFYQWNRPTLSLGRNEPGAGARTNPAVVSGSVGVVRRPTGGRAVLHHRELTYAVVAPARSLGGARAAYRSINRGLARGISDLGVRAEVASSGVVLPPDAGPCFAAPAPGEVVAGGRKLVGSAQVRIGGALLQHGSILIHDDQDMVAAGRGAPGGGDPERGESAGVESPAALADLLPDTPPLSRLIEVVLDGLAGELPGNWRGGLEKDSLPTHQLPHAPRPGLVERYRSSAWTWRR